MRVEVDVKLTIDDITDEQYNDLMSDIEYDLNNRIGVEDVYIGVGEEVEG